MVDLHNNVLHHCNKCDYVGTSKLHFRKHKNKQHARHRYPCDKCDYVEGDEYVLNTHIESQNFTKRHVPVIRNYIFNEDAKGFDLTALNVINPLVVRVI